MDSTDTGHCSPAYQCCSLNTGSENFNFFLLFTVWFGVKLSSIGDQTVILMGGNFENIALSKHCTLCDWTRHSSASLDVLLSYWISRQWRPAAAAAARRQDLITPPDCYPPLSAPSNKCRPAARPSDGASANVDPSVLGFEDTLTEYRVKKMFSGSNICSW